MNVGFIGLGNMGEPMAGWVLKAGLPLVVHDIREDAASPLLKQGAAWANSPAEVASRSDIVCVCVPGPPEMEAVSLGPDGAMRSGQGLFTSPDGFCVPEHRMRQMAPLACRQISKCRFRARPRRGRRMNGTET